MKWTMHITSAFDECCMKTVGYSIWFYFRNNWLGFLLRGDCEISICLGVRCVVSSTSRVDDAVALDVMITFYKYSPSPTSFS